MKKKDLLFGPFFILCLQVIFTNVAAQNYDLIDYSINGTPTYGVKIKTNIPFRSGSSMPTIRIEGYNYHNAQPIGINIVWYVFNNKFIDAAASSWGAYTPPIYLSNENGLITIFIDDRAYFQRFHVSAYAKGLHNEDSASFSGWTVADEPLGGTNQIQVPYKNKFAGKVIIDGEVGIGTTNPAEKLTVAGISKYNNILFTGNSTSGVGISLENTHSGSHKFDLFSSGSNNEVGNGSFAIYDETASSYRLAINSVGNVLIGKPSQTNTSYKLDVNGNIRANKVVVNTSGADYVFDTAYQLLSLDSLNSYIQQHHKLPEIPSAEEMQKNGMDVAKNQAALLKKIEELTLYIITLQKQINKLKNNKDSNNAKITYK